MRAEGYALRLCDICNKREATLVDRVVINNAAKEYCYCEQCYAAAIARGERPHEVAAQRLARRGLECEDCGCSRESFLNEYYFGCPNCYRNMRPVAEDAIRQVVAGYQGESRYVLDAQSPIGDRIRERMQNYAVSSRIRLARNVEGLAFPSRLYGRAGENRASIRQLFAGAMRSAEGAFDGEFYAMTDLDQLKKKMLVERHLISLPLANSEIGAVIIERGEPTEISVMLNEEDHIRAQCVRRGFDLIGAYDKLHRYDVNLARELPIATDERFGYLAACPTNAGTGMRASVMLFLPALKMTGAADAVLDGIKRRYGVTVRGYFGEGSDAAYDMYQISNGRTLGVDEMSTVRLVEGVAVQICRLEEEAMQTLLATQRTKLYDAVKRSYGILTSAHTLEAGELMELVVNVKIGVILGLIPLKMQSLNDVIDDCSSAFEIQNDGMDKEERGVERARIVRRRLGAK